MVKCPVVVDISIRWGWGWWCVGQWRKKESRDPKRQARTGNSPRTWPPNGHLNARPATVLVAVNRILPSVCLASLLFQDQPLLIGGGGGRIDNQTFPKISERLWTLLGTVGALLPPRDPVAWVHEGLDDIQHETHCHQHRPQRSPGAPQGVICALRL